MSRAKATKAIIFTAQAADHHTLVKIKNVMKWIKSGHEVRVQITGKEDRQKAMDTIFRNLESNVKSEARFSQKVVKPQAINVTLIPTNTEDTTKDEKT